MSEPLVSLNIHPYGHTILPRVRTSEEYTDGYWLDLRFGQSEVTIHNQSLPALRELARQINLEVDEAERREVQQEQQKRYAREFGPQPNEAEGLSPADQAEIIDALDLDTWTKSSGTHAELPDHLKPKRKPCWDFFEAGEVPVEGASDNTKLEYTRWKLAGGKVKAPSEADIQAALDFGKTAEQHLPF